MINPAVDPSRRDALRSETLICFSHASSNRWCKAPGSNMPAVEAHCAALAATASGSFSKNSGKFGQTGRNMRFNSKSGAEMHIAQLDRNFLKSCGISFALPHFIKFFLFRPVPDILVGVTFFDVQFFHPYLMAIQFATDTYGLAGMPGLDSAPEVWQKVMFTVW